MHQSFDMCYMLAAIKLGCCVGNSHSMRQGYLAKASTCPCFQCSPPAWVRELQSTVRKADRVLTLSLPCVGLSAPTQATRLLGVDVRGVEICDLEADLAPALEVIHANDELFLGHQKGDITKITEERLLETPCDALVS